MRVSVSVYLDTRRLIVRRTDQIRGTREITTPLSNLLDEALPVPAPTRLKHARGNREIRGLRVSRHEHFTAGTHRAGGRPVPTAAAVVHGIEQGRACWIQLRNKDVLAP